MPVCDFCGKSAPDDPSSEQAVPLTWMTSVENGRTRVYCDVCSRQYLRSIEAKLDSEWW